MKNCTILLVLSISVVPCMVSASTPAQPSHEAPLQALVQSTPYNQQEAALQVIYTADDAQEVFREFINTRPDYLTDVLPHLDMSDSDNRILLLNALKQAPAAWGDEVHTFFGKQDKINLMQVLRFEAEGQLAEHHTDRIFAESGPSGSDAIINSLGNTTTRFAALRVIAATKREELLAPVVRLLESPSVTEMEKRKCLETIARVGGEHASRTIDRFISLNNPMMLSHALAAVLIIGETNKGDELRAHLAQPSNLQPIIIQALSVSNKPLSPSELEQLYMTGGMEQKHAVLEAAAMDNQPKNLRILVLASMEQTSGLATKARSLLTTAR